MADDGKIIIRRAKVNNLKDVTVEIPRGKFVVITGVSGSGKSSLAFDTLFAEGQRRFAESLSSYARQFLGRMSKPDVELIEGIAPPKLYRYNRFVSATISAGLAEGKTIIHVAMSSGISSTYQNACIAAEEVGGVYVIDSRNLSTGIGLQVIRACELADKGMAAEVIVSYLREMAGRVDATFIPESLEYLKMGGRCSAATALSASLLRIKPCIQVRDGAMVVGKKYTGALEPVLMKYVKDRLGDLEKVDLSRVFITHSGMTNPELVDKVKEAVLAIAPFEDVQVTRAGCTVSMHCGPNTLGVLFCKK